VEPNNILKEKDDIIAYLRQIITIITENSDKKDSGAEHESLKNEVKILTIENEKLVNIIERNERLKAGEEADVKNNEHEMTLKELNNKIKENRIYYE
jgi:hypothetical protein